MNLEELYEKMLECNSCKLREMCSRVVTAIGNMESPILMIVGEAPGQEEDETGIPFVGRAGEELREAIRATGVINKKNTLITNTVHCRPPKNKFPTDETAEICVSKWLSKEIEIAKPNRLLLVGSKPLKYVAGLNGITASRGQWYKVGGIRTMATFHPSYVIRCEREGNIYPRELFRKDIATMAKEVASIEKRRKAK